MSTNENLLFAREDEYDDSHMQDQPSDSRKYLIFLVDDLKLGVDAEYVVEILNNHTITYLPMVPGYIQGIFNMRGQIIPIMDIRMRLGKNVPEGDALLIVLDYNDTQLGILVDAVDQIIDIPNEIIQPMPVQSSQILVSGMCTIPDGSGTMLMLDCEELLSHE